MKLWTVGMGRNLKRQVDRTSYRECLLKNLAGCSDDGPTDMIGCRWLLHDSRNGFDLSRVGMVHVARQRPRHRHRLRILHIVISRLRFLGLLEDWRCLDLD